jgi:hypothetical protein
MRTNEDGCFHAGRARSRDREYTLTFPELPYRREDRAVGSYD